MSQEDEHVTQHASPVEWRSVIVVVGCLVVLGAMATQWVMESRSSARRTTCRNHLKQYGIALHNYAEFYDGYPPGSLGNPQLPPEKRWSWLHGVGNFVSAGYGELGINFDKAWDDPTLRPLVLYSWRNGGPNGVEHLQVEPYPPLPPCPSFETRTHSDGQVYYPYISTAGLGTDAGKLPRDHPRAGMWAHNQQTRIADVIDGTSNTICIMESAKHAQCWLSGGLVRGLDTDNRYVGKVAEFGGVHDVGATTLFVDGAARLISNQIDRAFLESQMTIAGKEFQ